MNGWSVDPEGLRFAASVVRYAIQITEPETATAATARVGDAELAAALSAFMQALTGGWMQRVSATEGVCQTLAASATMYETADDEGVRDVRQADHF